MDGVVEGRKEGRNILKCLDPLVIGLLGICLKKLMNMNVCVSASLNR